MPKKAFLFTEHFWKDKDIDPSLAEECVFTGKKSNAGEPNKWKAVKPFRTGELIVVYYEFEAFYHVVTAYWNVRGVKP